VKYSGLLIIATLDKTKMWDEKGISNLTPEEKGGEFKED